MGSDPKGHVSDPDSGVPGRSANTLELTAQASKISAASSASCSSSAAVNAFQEIDPPAPAIPARPARSIVAVGGGKGGIGKSLITSSLGISLARRGQCVVVIDADLGGANLHTALGVSNPEVTLADFIHHRVSYF